MSVMFRVGKDGKRNRDARGLRWCSAHKNGGCLSLPWPRDLMLKDPHPAEVFLDKDYMAEMKRRVAIMGEGPVKHALSLLMSGLRSASKLASKSAE
jgi:hypothetical protein